MRPIAAMAGGDCSRPASAIAGCRLPYHIGNGWFGGLLPATALAIVAQTGNMFNGLWYPIIFAAITFVIGTLFIKETKNTDIYRND